MVISPREVTGSQNAQPLVQTTPEPTPATNKTNLLAYLKSPPLWLMGLFAIMSIGSSAVTTHEVSFITDMKVSETIAALARELHSV